MATAKDLKQYGCDPQVFLAGIRAEMPKGSKISQVRWLIELSDILINDVALMIIQNTQQKAIQACMRAILILNEAERILDEGDSQ